VSVHGANRLGGNSLLETIVFGRLVADAINARKEEPTPPPSEVVLQGHLKKTTERIDRLFDGKQGVPHHQISDNLKCVLTHKVGLFRNAADLAEAVAEIRELRGQYESVRLRAPMGPFNTEVLHALELESLLYLGEITARGALARVESRGSHFRVDHPDRDDAQWLKHTIAHRDGDDIRLSYADVDIGTYQPAKRTY
jgi:succinate dehydrogenase / fumarate reductase flavoprotein subunit